MAVLSIDPLLGSERKRAALVKCCHILSEGVKIQNTCIHPFSQSGEEEKKEMKIEDKEEKSVIMFTVQVLILFPPLF